MSRTGPLPSHGNPNPPPPGRGQYPAHGQDETPYDPRNYAEQPGARPPFDSNASLDSAGYPRAAPGERPYAPSEPYPHDFNILAPYNEEKAYAEYTDAYGPPPSEYTQSGSRAPRPPEDYDGYDEARYRDPRYPYYYEETPDLYADPRYYEDGPYSRPPPPDRARYRDDDDDRASYDPRPPPSRPRRLNGKKDKDVFGQSTNGERGLASAVLGGAAGAWIGHEAGRGMLGTLGGLAVGAIGGTALEKQHDKYREKKQRKRRSADDYVVGSGSRDYRPRRRDSSFIPEEYAPPPPPPRRELRYASPERRRWDSPVSSREPSLQQEPLPPRRRYTASPDSYLDYRR